MENRAPYEAVRTAVIDRLANFPEEHVDQLLRTAHVSPTDRGWEQKSEDQRRNELAEKITDSPKSRRAVDILWPVLLPIDSKTGYALIEEAQRPGMQPSPHSAVDPGGPIFLVHGHDHALRHEVVAFLRGRPTARSSS